jgi:hypothetical protein
VDSIKPLKYLPIDHDQASRNYRSFGDALRIFLQGGTSIAETSSPKTYLQVLSLCDVRDGFLLLRDLVFSLSPQLTGKYYDYRNNIDTLVIIPGENLSKFYQCIIKLSNEIELSNILNGNMALLAHCFIFLLRSTTCATITNLVSPYWKSITKHRRDPNHLTERLPWHFREVYDDLISSNIIYLPKGNLHPLDESPLPNAARALSQPRNTNMSNKISTKPSNFTTIGIHRTRDGRKFISHHNKILSSKQPSCQLCFNQHASPWHATDDCPYKHPTHIVSKDIRERVMQHNALHGAENKHYSKTQDLPTAASSPRQATGHSATTLESSHLPHDTSITEPLIETTTDETTPLLDDSNEVIDTEYFDIPIVDAIANVANINPTTPYADIKSNAVITDHLQYLSYES